MGHLPSHPQVHACTLHTAPTTRRKVANISAKNSLAWMHETNFIQPVANMLRYLSNPITTVEAVLDALWPAVKREVT